MAELEEIRQRRAAAWERAQAGPKDIPFRGTLGDDG